MAHRRVILRHADRAQARPSFAREARELGLPEGAWVVEVHRRGVHRPELYPAFTTQLVAAAEDRDLASP